MNVVWTDLARTNRAAIFDFIEADNVQAAIRMDNRFSEVATILSGRPLTGRPGRVAGTREFVAHKNYIIVYEIDERADKVYIIAVLHAAQQYPSLRP